MKKNPTVKVVQAQPPADQIGAEVIASSIVEIAAAMKAINETRLTRRAIVALIANRSKLGHGVIEIVLNNLDDLENDWLKPVEPKR